MVLNEGVHACDICIELAILATDEDRKKFDSGWYSSLAIDICPECRGTESGKALIETDKTVMAEFRSEVFSHYVK